MNAVHAVLRNWDISQAIINFVKDDLATSSWRFGGRNLVALALVCRALSDLALNVLWRDIDMENIYFLFPMDSISIHPRGTKSLIRIPDTPQEWERFDIYASRIRKLSASPSPNDLFLRGFRTRHPNLRHPFPNLTCFQWSSPPSLVADAITLICPTITEVRLWIAYLDGDEDDDAVANVLRSLGETCLRLTKFEYMHYFTTYSRSRAIEISLVYLVRQCRHLEEVQLPISPVILCSLASLTHLSTLRLDHATWEDELQLHLHIEADERIEEAGRFPVLDELTIQGSHTVASLTECFQGSGCFPRVDFTMTEMSECEEWSTLAIDEFFRGIFRPDRGEKLQVFSIERYSQVENPVGHDPWQALRCLSFIPNLRTLCLEGFFLDINDTDLAEMPRIWPELQSLWLEVPRTDDYQSRISFQGLAHLSTLKRLKKRRPYACAGLHHLGIDAFPNHEVQVSIDVPFDSGKVSARYSACSTIVLDPPLPETGGY